MGTTSADAKSIAIESPEGLSACVSMLGAQLTSLSLDGREYLWQADKRWWPRSAPVLFPIVGSLRAGTTSAQGPCPMGRHGVARGELFSVLCADAGAVTLELSANERTLAAYPFRFRLRMTYALAGSTLTQRFEVTNAGDVPLPFTLGAHPAFNVPLCPGETFESYALRFSRPWSASSPTMVDGGLWDFSRRIPLVRDSDELRLSRELFATDTVMLEDVPERRVTLEGPAGHGVRVSFADFPYLGIWSAAGNAPFVAIEPWRGCSTATDEGSRLEDKRQTRTLMPGETDACSLEVTPF